MAIQMVQMCTSAPKTNGLNLKGMVQEAANDASRAVVGAFTQEGTCGWQRSFCDEVDSAIWGNDNQDAVYGQPSNKEDKPIV